MSPDSRPWLAAIAAAAPGAGVVVFDDDGRVRFVDGPWLTGLGIEPVVGRLLRDLMSAESWAALKEPYQAAVAGHTSRFEFLTGGARFSIHVSPLALADRQIIVAAEIAVESPDFGHLEPAVRAVLRGLQDAGVTQRSETVLADAGYWHTRQMENIVSDGIQVLVPPDAGLREDIRPGWDRGPYAFMRRVLASEAGHELYKHRKATVEPVFAQNKFNRGFRRFHRRG